MAKRIKVTAEEKNRIRQLHALAAIYGFNELAKNASTLGEKIFYRLACFEAEKKFKKLGGQININETETPVLVVPGPAPSIKLYPRDIELMRAAVAAYDQSANESEK